MTKQIVPPLFDEISVFLQKTEIFSSFMVQKPKVPITSKVNKLIILKIASLNKKIFNPFLKYIEHEK